MLCLSPYIGAGTRALPFMPRGLDIPGASAIDLRPDCSQLDGAGFPFALLWLPAGEPLPLGSFKLGETSGELLSLSSKTLLGTKTGLDFSKDRLLLDIVSTLLIAPPKNAWQPLRPANGRLEAWIGSEIGRLRWVDQPVIAGGSISDNFNRANETPLASPWTALAGSTGAINLSTNAITKSAVGDCLYYYSYGAGWSADQSSQFDYVTSITSTDWGPAVRIGGGAGFSCYFYSQWSGRRDLAKFVSGAFTAIEAAAGAGTTGNSYKIDAAGSTLSYYDNGSANANSPATDTTISSAGNGPGVFLYQTGGSLDNFLATGELSATTERHQTRHMISAGGFF